MLGWWACATHLLGSRSPAVTRGTSLLIWRPQTRTKDALGLSHDFRGPSSEPFREADLGRASLSMRHWKHLRLALSIRSLAAAVALLSFAPKRRQREPAVTFISSSPGDYHPWLAPFRSRIDATLSSGIRILDLGAGRRPVLLPGERPPQCHYTGMDISEQELCKAPRHSYDERVAADMTTYQSQLCASFDLIISWQVLEHVRPLDVAFANIHSYLRPGGQVVLFFSGAFSVIAVANRLLPSAVGRRVIARIMKRDPNTVFPAFYDQCHPRGLQRMLARWTDWEIVPVWGGAGYLSSVPRVQKVYDRYEAWAKHGQHDSLATHYLVSATK